MDHGLGLQGEPWADLGALKLSPDSVHTILDLDLLGHGPDLDPLGRAGPGPTHELWTF